MSWEIFSNPGKTVMKKFYIIVFSVILFLLIVTLVSISQQSVEMPHGDIKYDCDECHTAKNWKVDPSRISFEHRKTGFPLIGVHAIAQCRACHQSLVFSKIGSACVDCHMDIHTGKLGIHCENCHSPVNWEDRQDQFQAHNRTLFPLLGVHALVDCDACHLNQQQDQFALTPVECFGCHLEDYNATENPNHKKAGFDLNCLECHQPQFPTWQKTTFQHTSAFKLDGAHLQSDCNGCHAETFIGTPIECIGCHRTDYLNTTNPNHVVFGFLEECTLCHTTQQWQGAFFDHVQASGFALVGAHMNLQCNECHINNQVSGLPRDCFGCHENDYNIATDPNHVQNNFNHDCTLCHSTNAWEPATFDHNNTQFPLTGAHLSLQCIDCHAGGYTGTPTDCFSCHENDYNSVTDPNHVQNNFSHDCTQCHSTSAWEPATFDHNQTQFPLTGAHLSLQCIDCHANGYTGTPTDCFSCHENDFNSVTDPNHVQNNFSHDCTQCHSTSGWEPATFDHNQTQFPLTGAHLNLQCIDCHANGYTGTPTDCFSCHDNDYNSVTDPNHVQNNFSHDCTLCHSTNAWEPATFDHNQTQFPLSGAHLNLQCIDCHANGYTGTPTDCYSCHSNDYNSTTNPNHVAAGFPTQCETCHNTSNWTQTTWNHDAQYFPIYSGRHQGEWTVCADCHVDPNNYSVFECIFCHEHNDPNELQSQHQGVSGYQYVSTACYNCHPNGEAD
jgi:nitrate/TMAO reductase-like tetraheme cytochrome c subunit